MTYISQQIDHSNFFFRLSLMMRTWRQVVDTEIQTSGLTDATWRPLLHLHLLGDGTRQKKLAESLGIKGPSIVRLLDTLIGKGLIRRLEDDSDRRAKLLYLTSEGRLLVERIQKKVTALENEFLSVLDDGEFSQMAGFTQRLESNVNSLLQKKNR